MSKPSLPKPLPGYAHVNRYWDKSMGVPAAKILPGEFYVSDQGEMVVTVLGSCIAACVRDKKIGIGGMNHFMLPATNEHSSWDTSEASSAARYGNWAMEYLINGILKVGGKRENLEVKLFGGGQIMKNMTDIGARNIEFVLEYMKQEKLKVVASDIGGTWPRKVLYFSDTGSVKMRRLKSTSNETVQQREQQYCKTLVQKPDTGSVELF